MRSPRLLVGTVFVAALAATLLWPSGSLAQRTSVARDFPIYENGGKPDLVLDPQRFVAQMEIVDRVFDPGDCAIAEGVVGGAGIRRLLRFDTVLMNRGDGDLVVGDRSDPNNPYAPYFVFHQCHGHYHIRYFSIYELLTLDGQVVVAGTKQGFCFEDSFKYKTAARAAAMTATIRASRQGGETGTTSSSWANGSTSPACPRAITSCACR